MAPHPLPIHPACSNGIAQKETMIKEEMEYRYFPENTKNPEKQNGRLIAQSMNSKAKTFDNLLYVDDGALSSAFLAKTWKPPS